MLFRKVKRLLYTKLSYYFKEKLKSMYRKHQGLLIVQILLSVGIVVLLNSYLKSRPDLQDKVLPDLEQEVDVVLDPVVVSNDLDFQENIDKAYQFLSDHNYNTALAYFKLANAQAPDRKEPFLGVAETFLELDKLEPAKNNINSAALLGDFSVDDNNLLVKFYILNRQLDKAAEVYTSISNKNNESYFLGALINLMQPNLENAKQKLGVVVASVNSSEYSSVKDLEILEASEVLLDDIAVYETFIDSPHSYLLTLTGQSLIALDELSLSRRFFFEGIREKGDYRDAWLYLGYSYLLSDNLAEAEKTLTKAKELDPYEPLTYFYLGMSQLGQGKYNDSIRSLEQASGFGYEPSYVIQEYLGHNYYKLEKYDQAYNSYNQVVSQRRASLETYIRLAWILIEVREDRVGAIDNGLKVVGEYPDEAMSYNILGWSYLADGNYELALIELEKSLELDNELEAAYLNIGLVYLEQERIDLAVTNLEQALELASLNSNDGIYQRAELILEGINNEI